MQGQLMDDSLERLSVPKYLDDERPPLAHAAMFGSIVTEKGREPARGPLPCTSSPHGKSGLDWAIPTCASSIRLVCPIHFRRSSQMEPSLSKGPGASMFASMVLSHGEGFGSGSFPSWRVHPWSTECCSATPPRNCSPDARQVLAAGNNA